MRNKFFLTGIIFLGWFGCSEDDNEPTSVPTNFEITTTTKVTSATIIWTESKSPDGDDILYDIYLENELKVAKTTSLTHTFNDLAPDTFYSGEIIASDTKGTQTIVAFSFTTMSTVYVPIFNRSGYRTLLLETQEEVEEFGAVGYTRIAGNLAIGGNESDISDLSPLQGITLLDGSLIVETGNSLLTSLNGLQNITMTTKGASLSISHNHGLKNLDELKNLVADSVVISSLKIGNNTSLTNIDGLQSITKLGYILMISGNPLLTNLDGLQNMTSDGDDLYSLIISYNASLGNIDGLQNMTSDSDGLYSLMIESNNSLTNIDGLQNITKVDSRLHIIGNPTLANIDGLQNVTSKSPSGLFSLRIEGNTALTNIDGLQSITKLHYTLSIVGNSALTNLDGLQNVTTGDDGYSNLNGLYIEDNAALTNIDGLQNISVIYYTISIKGNDVLTNLNGLQNVTPSNGYSDLHELYIEDNAALTNIDGLIKFHIFAKETRIERNASLNNLNGLQNVREGSGDIVYIRGNTALTDFCGIKYNPLQLIIGSNAFNPTLYDLFFVSPPNCSL